MKRNNILKFKSRLKQELMEEPLIPISPEEMNTLLEFYNTGTAEDAYVQGMVKTAIRWKGKKDDGQSLELYTPYGDVSSGVIVSIFNSSAQFVSFYAPEASNSKFIDSLIGTTLIDWETQEKDCYIYDLPERLMPFINIVTSVRRTIGMELVFLGKTQQYWLRKEQALLFDITCPVGLRLQDLTLDMVQYMDEHWPYRFPGSVEYAKQLLKKNFGIGLFLNNGTKPVAWVVCTQLSTMGMLYTLEAHRRKGYAELVIASMAKRLAELGIDPKASVFASNHKSHSLFVKLGFHKGVALNNLYLKSKR